MKQATVAALLLLAALTTACESGLDQRYLDASLGKNLELPPDLTEVEGESKFELPTGFAGDDARVRDKLPVLAKVDSLRLQGSVDHYWLSIEAPVENLYQLVKNFWAAEGYQLVLDEPVIGIMQTEWIYKEEGTEKESDSWFSKLFSSADLSARQDQFRTRIERDESGQGNRIYIVHRGTEYSHVIETGDRLSPGDVDTQWRFRQPDPELEIEMLSRLMIYLGLQQAQVEQQLEKVKLFAPRAFMHMDSDENSPFLIVKDAYHLAWNRVYHQLQRMNFEIASADFKSGFSGEGVFIVNAKVLQGKDGKGLASLFTSTVPKDRQFVLVLSEETHELTRVELETIDGDLDSSNEGARFLKLLYQQVR